MKKLLLVIPLALLLIHFAYESMGPNMWTATITTTGAIWQGCIVINPTNQQIMYAASFSSGIWKSTNGGLNWAQSNGSMTNLTMQAIAISKSNPNVLYCGTSGTGFNNGMYKTTDAGATWTQINTGITQTPIAIQAIDISPTDPNVAYIGIWDANPNINAADGLYKTTNGGTSWAVANTGITDKNILCVLVNRLNPNTVYAGTSFMAVSIGPCYIYKSYNGGATWASFSSGLPVGTTEINPVRHISMSTLDTNILIAGLFQNTTTGGAYFTSNGGTSWIRRSTGIPNVAGVLPRSTLIRPGSNTEFYVGLDNATTGGVYKTTDAGNTWVSFNSGVMQSSYAVRALTFRTTIDSTLFAGVGGTTGSGFGIYEYSYGPLGINDPNKIPSEFSLEQNYPNPFNPVTVIEYSIPKSAFVKIKVYDVSGREVKVLVNEQKSPGNYNITFTAEGLASGIYLYSIDAGDFKEVKKMSLVK